MADDWESIAESDLVLKPKLPAPNNRWAGEDEDDVKDSWEDEEEKKDEEKTASVKTSPKIAMKALKAELMEKNRLAEEEEEKRLANMTPAERMAEKQRLQKLQEEADLHNALETLGISDTGLDHFRPETAEDFKEFASAISWKLSHYKESPHFSKFMEEVVRNMCTQLNLQDLKRIKIAVEASYFEKQKQEKPVSKKTSTKAKTKVTIKAQDDVIDEYKKFGDGYSYNNNDAYDGYDDFM